VPLLEQVLEKYPADVKIAFKNFPIRSHKFAKQAAIAALAADSQGKFWEFHDLLFKNYNRLNDQVVRDLALGLGLNQAQYQKKLKDPTLAGRVRQDELEGRRAGVKGTPTIFINGRLLKSRSLQGFQAAIDKELKKAGKTATKPSS
jgi:protein-disulfide isomerase